jgi:hypothetical protein
MPRPASTSPKTRFNLDLHPDHKEKLKELQHRLRADSMSEVIRRMIPLYESLLDNRDGGGVLIVRSEDGTETQLLLF